MDRKHGERLKQHFISSTLSLTAVCIKSSVSSGQKKEEMRTCKSRTSGGTDPQKKVGLDWPHPQETCQQHHQAGSDLESIEDEKEGEIQEYMAQRHPGGNAEKRSLLEGAGEEGPESGALVDCGAKCLSKKQIFSNFLLLTLVSREATVKREHY